MGRCLPPGDRRWSLALVLAGCWTSTPPHPPPPEAPRGIAFPVDPRLLGDDGFVARLDHHAWLTRYGRAWIRLDEELPEVSTEIFDVRQAVAVLDVGPGRVRMLVEGDDARLAVWVERRNLAPTVVGRVQVAGDSVHGVWLAPGTEIRDPATAISGRRDFDLLDAEVQVHATVGPDVIGDVWVGPVPRETPDPTTPAWVASTPIRVAPDANARVLAEVTAVVGATVVKDAGAWSDVEIEHHGVHVRGYVPTNTVGTEGYGTIGGLEAGGGYGISDSETVILPAGACLYARQRGPVVGVNTKERERYIRASSSAWPGVIVQTPWGLTTITVHVVGRDEDVPRFAMCAR